jgi:hypothetical protein
MSEIEIFHQSSEDVRHARFYIIDLEVPQLMEFFSMSGP